jgi:Cytochrome b involved in lipid metabolism
MVWEDGSITRKPLDHNTSANDNAGFHHMHRLDLLMCLYKRVLEFAPETGVNCPIQVHMAKRLEAVSQDEESVTVTFSDGTTETGDLLIGADGVDSQVLEAVWPGVSTKRWTEVVVYRGLVPRDKVAAARKPDGSPLDYNPIETMSMDTRETPTAQHLTYWVRGGELLNVWLAYYGPNAAEFGREEGDWFPADRDEMVGNMSKAFEGDPRHDDVVALTSLMENPTKWGLYDRDALGTGRRVAWAWWVTPLTRCCRPSARVPRRPSRTPRHWASASSSTARTSTARCCTTSACATTARRASSSRRSSSSSTSSRRTHLSAGRSSLRSTSGTTPSSITRSVRAATTRGSTRSTRAGSATSCRSGSSGRGLPLAEEALKSARREVATSLWKPAKPWTGDRPVTREELAQHATFDDCWVVIRGKVYDFTEWKDHHPGGPFVARMYGGKDATAEFGEYHSRLAERHMQYFCVGPLVGAPAERAGDASEVEPSRT